VTNIANGSTSSYYFQISSSETTPDVSFGLSDLAAPGRGDFNDFEVQIALTSDANGLRIGARNGGTAVLDLVTGLSANTWYDIWVIVDNNKDTYDLYFGTGLNPDRIADATRIANNYGFRNGTNANDLVTFMNLANCNDSLSARVDNIYYHAGDVAPPSADNTAPAAPAGLSAVTGDGTVSLNWNDNSESDLAGYTVYRSTTSGSGYSAIASGLGASACTNSGLVNGTTYYYVVTASDDSENASGYSAEVSAIPSAPVSSNELTIAGHTIVNGTNLVLTVSNTVPGHLYGILVSDSLTPPAWSNIVTRVGNSSNLLFNLPINGAETKRFYKLDVQRQ
jgi:hypothetical protein